MEFTPLANVSEIVSAPDREACARTRRRPGRRPRARRSLRGPSPLGALGLAFLGACAGGGEHEWLLEIDPGWGSEAERRAVFDDEVAALRRRVQVLNEVAREEGWRVGVERVEVGEDGSIVVAVTGRGAGDLDLQTLLRSRTTALHLVAADVRADGVADLDSVLVEHAPSLSLPGVGLVEGLGSTTGHPVREEAVEEVQAYLSGSVAVGALEGRAVPVWSASEGTGQRDLFFVRAEPLVTHDDIEDAYVAYDGDDIGIAIALTEEAGRRVRAVTSRNVGGSAALLMDGEVTTEPILIADAFGRYARFDAGWVSSESEAHALVLDYRAGLLPAPLVVAGER